ncbi:MAG: hypothetical protein L0216_12700, partial [Planctomycetales bacterium]|nr:hypothetical protein [Planctomycetales bacterium]
LSERSESNGMPDGTVRVTDRDGVPLGSGEPLGIELDRPLLETLWSAAFREVAARMAASDQPRTWDPGPGTDGSTLSSSPEARTREPEPALTAVF